MMLLLLLLTCCLHVPYSTCTKCHLRVNELNILKLGGKPTETGKFIELVKSAECKDEDSASLKDVTIVVGVLNSRRKKNPTPLGVYKFRSAVSYPTAFRKTYCLNPTFIESVTGLLGATEKYWNGVLPSGERYNEEKKFKNLKRKKTWGVVDDFAVVGYGISETDHQWKCYNALWKKGQVTTDFSVVSEERELMRTYFAAKVVEGNVLLTEAEFFMQPMFVLVLEEKKVPENKKKDFEAAIKAMSYVATDPKSKKPVDVTKLLDNYGPDSEEWKSLLTGLVDGLIFVPDGKSNPEESVWHNEFLYSLQKVIGSGKVLDAPFSKGDLDLEGKSISICLGANGEVNYVKSSPTPYQPNDCDGTRMSYYDIERTGMKRPIDDSQPELPSKISRPIASSSADNDDVREETPSSIVRQDSLADNSADRPNTQQSSHNSPLIVDNSPDRPNTQQSFSTSSHNTPDLLDRSLSPLRAHTPPDRAPSPGNRSPSPVDVQLVEDLTEETPPRVNVQRTSQRRIDTFYNKAVNEEDIRKYLKEHCAKVETKVDEVREEMRDVKSTFLNSLTGHNALLTLLINNLPAQIAGNNKMYRKELSNDLASVKSKLLDKLDKNVEFRYYRYDPIHHSLRCDACYYYAEENVLFGEKDGIPIKVDDRGMQKKLGQRASEHLSTNVHRKAVKKHESTCAEQLGEPSKVSDVDATKNMIEIVYFEAYKNIPAFRHKDLVELIEKLGVKVGDRHRSRTSFSAMLSMILGPE